MRVVPGLSRWSGPLLNLRVGKRLARQMARRFTRERPVMVSVREQWEFRVLGKRLLGPRCPTRNS